MIYFSIGELRKKNLMDKQEVYFLFQLLNLRKILETPQKVMAVESFFFLCSICSPNFNPLLIEIRQRLADWIFLPWIPWTAQRSTQCSQCSQCSKSQSTLLKCTKDPIEYKIWIYLNFWLKPCFSNPIKISKLIST